MNKKILCVLPLSFLVVACTSQQGLMSLGGCETRRPTEHCVDNRAGGTTPFVNVTTKGWKVAPPNVCVSAGDTLEIRFQGPTPAPNTLGTIPIGSAAFWLVGRNSPDDEMIVLTVPDGPGRGDYFDYAILSESNGCVDPRATYE